MTDLLAKAPNLYHHQAAGDWQRIGSEFGGAVATRLRELCQRRSKQCELRWGSGRVDAAIDEIARNYEAAFPYLSQELTSISAVAELPIGLLQRHLFMAGLPIFFPEDDGCTDIIIPASEVGPLLGKTHDATIPEPGPAIVRHIKPLDYYQVLCVTQLDGLACMTGLNDQGLAVGEASLHFYTSNKAGIVRNLLLRPLLHECANVAEGISFLEEYSPLNFGFHFALVDRAGKAAIVERAPDRQNVRWSKGKSIFCTNHTATPEMRAREKSRGEDGDRNSDTRYNHLLAAAQSNRLTSLSDLRTIMSTRFDDGGICQHGDPEFQGAPQPFYPLHTQRAFINVVEQGRLLVSNGKPCEGEYLEFQL